MKSKATKRAKRVRNTAFGEIASHHQPRAKVGIFTALYPGVCASCYEEITVGTTCHYNSAGQVVHHTHHRVERPVVVCSSCYLTKPCECDD